MVTTPPSRKKDVIASIALTALGWALLFLVIGVGGDYLASRFGLERDLLYVNDIVSAAFIAILIVRYEVRRWKRLRERLEIIELMNHHVRNALQVIAFSPHTRQREDSLALINDSVRRIEWALREILPGGKIADLDPADKEHVA